MRSLTRNRSTSTLSLVVFLGLFTLTFLVAGLALVGSEMASDQFRVAAILVLSGFVTVAAPVGTAILHRPYDIFHPLNFAALSLFFGVFGRVIYLLTSNSPAALGLLEGQGIDSLIPGALLSMVGSTLICIGFVCARQTELRVPFLGKILEGFREERLMFQLPVVFVVCAFGVALFLQATGFEYSGILNLSQKRRVVINDVESSLGYHRLIAQDVPRAILLVLTAMWCAGYRRSHYFRAALIGFAGMAILLPFLASSRANVLYAMIAVCVVINRARGIKLHTLAITGVMACVVIFGMLMLRRVTTRNESVSVQSIAEMGLEPLFGNHSFADVCKLSHVYQAVPGLIDYKYGASFAGILWAPIPRQVWPGKPEIAMGREITEKIYNRGMKMKKKGGGTPPGIFVESIVNFSVYGFPFALLVVGALFRVLYNSLNSLAARSAPGIALYGGVLPLFVMNVLSGDFTRALVQSLSLTLIVIAICLATRIKVYR